MRQTSSRRCRHQPLGTNVNQVEWYRKERGHTLVRLALLPELTGCLDGRFAPVLMQVVVRHDLTTHELVLEVRTAHGVRSGTCQLYKGVNVLDDTSRLRSLCTSPDCPGTYFVGTTGEVSDKLFIELDQKSVADGEPKNLHRDWRIQHV